MFSLNSWCALAQLLPLPILTCPISKQKCFAHFYALLGLIGDRVIGSYFMLDLPTLWLLCFLWLVRIFYDFVVSVFFFCFLRWNIISLIVNFTFLFYFFVLSDGMDCVLYFWDRFDGTTHFTASNACWWNFSCSVLLF